MDAIRRRLETRSLVPGERLPSIRALAATLRVSPSTVVEAYDRLAAEGLIHARPGSGFYASAVENPLSVPEDESRRDRTIDPLWVSRQALDTATGLIKPGCGWLPADWMPQAAIRRTLRDLSRADDATLVDYGCSRGSLGLRRTLARLFALEGLDVGTDHLLLAASGTQALDLVLRFVLRPGDTVLLDDPCYFNFRAVLAAHGARVAAVPYGPAGPDLPLFAAALDAHRPRVYITNSALHNPTGATPSAQVAHGLLNLAASHDLTIVEDDVFADLAPEAPIRLAALDGLTRVIRIGSFSKTMSASIRCGYIAARPDLCEALADLQVATNFGGPSPFSAELVSGVLGGGGYRKHVDALRRRLVGARREVADGLAAYGVRPLLEPRGGFYLWCSLPDGLDAASVARAALRDDLVLAPGDVFSPSRSARSAMRFNVAQMTDARAFEALGRAMAQGRADALSGTIRPA